MNVHGLTRSTVNSFTSIPRSAWDSFTSWASDLLRADRYETGTPAGEPQAPRFPANGPVLPLEEPLPRKKWTIMFWSASDTNLYPYMQDDLDRAEAVGGTPQMNLIVQTDHAPAGGGARRYELQKDAAVGLHSPIRAELGNTSMADPARLSDFIQWGMKNYPAEHYVLVIGGHGDGPYGLCRDDSTDSWMSIDGLQEGLREAREKTGHKLHVMCFDACLMGNAEVLHQLKDQADYIVASEEIADAAGWNYNQALIPGNGAYSAPGDFTPEDFARAVVTMAGGRQNILPTMAAYDTARLQEVTDAVRNFARAIHASQLPADDLKASRREAQRFRQFNDLSHFASLVEAHAGSNDELREAARAVQAAVSNAVISEEHSTSYPNARGLSIELDQRAGQGYRNLSFARETGWDEVLERINEKSNGDSPGAGSSLKDLLNAEGLP